MKQVGAMDMLRIAVDFDGTLCEYAFPEIGKQTEEHKELLEILIKLKSEGHKIILWTNRGDNDQYKSLTEAVDWCRSKGLEFDAINENLPDQKKLSGYSPKIMADYYIDDRALQFGDEDSRRASLSYIKKNL
tara:strand:- start:580 stop:975 length:396 start_codon:yes stop_codon:yes gene_type:complete